MVSDTDDLTLNGLALNGLVLDNIDLMGTFGAPNLFQAPAYLDNRPYCLPASNQGRYPACAGFAIAGYCEVQQWKENHIPTQIDGIEIWKRGLIHMPGNLKSGGITLEAAFKSAREFGYLPKGSPKVLRTFRDLQFALHTHTVAVAGMKTTDLWDNPTQSGLVEQKGPVRGYHAVLICYYHEQWGVGFQNSWHAWGANGFGRLSYKDFDSSFEYAIVWETQ